MFLHRYLGRKIMQPKKEFFVENMEHLVYPSYCYWTIGYILTIEGARKLIDAMPLQNLIPVDEFLPIMFDKHPRYSYLANYKLFCLRI